jgi:hypothetical protein
LFDQIQADNIPHDYSHYGSAIDACAAAGDLAAVDTLYLRALEEGVMNPRRADKPLSTLDLHRHTVEMALSVMRVLVPMMLEEPETREALDRDGLTLITGHGMNREEPGSKIKPMLLEYLPRQGIPCRMHEWNPGQIIVEAADLEGWGERIRQQ